MIDQGDTHAWARCNNQRSSYYVCGYFRISVRLGFCSDEKAFL